MLEENTNPEAEHGSEQAGNEVTDMSLGDTPETSSDPLDQIDDPEQLRHQAKRFRGIANRKGSAQSEGEDSESAEDTATPASDYMTKRDFHRVNEKEAIRTVTASNPEIQANWNQIKGFYTPRRGKDTAVDIAEDIQDAFTLWQKRSGGTTADPASNLTTTTVTAPTGGAPKAKVTGDNDPRFNTAAQPDDWYKK
jgi:hypothetical protein